MQEPAIESPLYDISNAERGFSPNQTSQCSAERLKNESAMLFDSIFNCSAAYFANITDECVNSSLGIPSGVPKRTITNPKFLFQIPVDNSVAAPFKPRLEWNRICRSRCPFCPNTSRTERNIFTMWREKSRCSHETSFLAPWKTLSIFCTSSLKYLRICKYSNFSDPRIHRSRMGHVCTSGHTTLVVH